MELQPFYRAPLLYLDPVLMQQRVLEDQVELWWFREPRRSLLCYCASVALVLGLGLGGVGLLSTATSLTGEWRLGVGATLCLLALAVLLKQLLSSAIQDMNCVRSRRRIEQLKSGGGADPALMLAAGVGVMVCGAVLLGLAAAGGGRGQDAGEMLASSAALMAAGAATSLAVVCYGALICLRRRRRRGGRRTARRMGGGPAVAMISGGRADQSGRDAASGRT